MSDEAIRRTGGRGHAARVRASEALRRSGYGYPGKPRSSPAITERERAWKEGVGGWINQQGPVHSIPCKMSVDLTLHSTAGD